MKLNVTQSKMLAESIREEISKKLKKSNLEKAEKLAQELLEKTSVLKEELNKKEKEIKILEKKIDKIVDTFNDKNNISLSRYYLKDSDIEYVVKKIAEKGIPTIDELHKKITLKALFSTEEDLQNFMSSIVKEYTNE